MSKPTIGWIGLGHAGYPMAANLPKANYSLLVRDADPTREHKFVKEYPNCQVAGLGEDAFQKCDIVITMLPNGKVVQDVLLGKNGIGRSLKAGTFL